MTIDYQLELEEYIALQERRPFSSPTLSWWYYYAILPALCAGLAMAADSLLVAVIFTLLYIGAGQFIQRLIQQSCRRTYYTADNLSFSTRPFRVTLTDEGARFTTEASESLFRWAFVREVCQSGAYVNFMLTPLQGMHIPMRAFNGEEHVQKFIDTAQSHIKLHAPKSAASSAIVAKP